MHTLSLQPTPCGAVTSSSQAHSRPVFIGRSPANQIRVNETSWEEHPIFFFTSISKADDGNQVDTLSESVCGESTGLVEPLIDLVGD